jgi:SAM-dependent methyltransferase
MPNVDHRVDLRKLPFADGSYDVIYASHVFEHIKEDEPAIAEVRRVLRPRGFAILPVPIYGATTVEYPKPDPVESCHVRAPGLDYFDRYRRCFSRVEVYSSDDFPADYQTHIYYHGSWQSKWPPMPEFCRPRGRFLVMTDFVPVCYV